jgi:hypothetical protein
VIAHDDFVRAMGQAGFSAFEVRLFMQGSISHQRRYRAHIARMAVLGSKWQRLHELVTAIEVAELLEN